ncbi:ABC transporter permease subunit [Streptomyces sp. PRKS01-65]|nr:ABC transporter permease subunit [Streptomyces harenosi]
MARRPGSSEGAGTLRYSAPPGPVDAARTPLSAPTAQTTGPWGAAQAPDAEPSAVRSPDNVPSFLLCVNEIAPEGAVNSVLDTIGLGSLAQNWLGDPGLALWIVLGVLVWMQLGYPLVLFMSGLQRIDPELYEAASLDGASWWQRFTRITVPILRPEVYVVLVTTTIAGLKVFAQIFVLTGGGPGNSTLVPAYFAYQNFFERADVGYGSAISSTITLLVLIIAGTMLTRQAREDG